MGVTPAMACTGCVRGDLQDVTEYTLLHPKCTPLHPKCTLYTGPQQGAACTGVACTPLEYP